MKVKKFAPSPRSSLRSSRAVQMAPPRSRFDWTAGIDRAASSPRFEREPSRDQGALLSPVPTERQRPIYVIAHKCTRTAKVKAALDAGANAIECDLKLRDGKWVVNHDPTDHKVDFTQWLNDVGRYASEPDSQLALIVFDIKTPEKKVKDLQTEARSRLPDDLNLLFSTGALQKGLPGREGGLKPIMKDLDSNEGVAIDQDKDQEGIEGGFRSEGVSNYWYGYGVDPLPNVAEGILPFDAFGVQEQIRRAVRKRDSSETFKKVYVWTVEDERKISDYIKGYGVDGIMVNHGQIRSTTDLIDKDRNVRLATRYDSAFELYTGHRGGHAVYMTITSTEVEDGFLDDEDEVWGNIELHGTDGSKCLISPDLTNDDIVVQRREHYKSVEEGDQQGVTFRFPLTNFDISNIERIVVTFRDADNRVSEGFDWTLLGEFTWVTPFATKSFFTDRDFTRYERGTEYKVTMRMGTERIF